MAAGVQNWGTFQLMVCLQQSSTLHPPSPDCVDFVQVRAHKHMTLLVLTMIVIGIGRFKCLQWTKNVTCNSTTVQIKSITAYFSERFHYTALQ